VKIKITLILLILLFAGLIFSFPLKDSQQSLYFEKSVNWLTPNDFSNPENNYQIPPPIGNLPQLNGDERIIYTQGATNEEVISVSLRFIDDMNNDNYYEGIHWPIILPTSTINVSATQTGSSNTRGYRFNISNEMFLNPRLRNGSAYFINSNQISLDQLMNLRIHNDFTLTIRSVYNPQTNNSGNATRTRTQNFDFKVAPRYVITNHVNNGIGHFNRDIYVKTYGDNNMLIGTSDVLFNDGSYSLVDSVPGGKTGEYRSLFSMENGLPEARITIDKTIPTQTSNITNNGISNSNQQIFFHDANLSNVKVFRNKNLVSTLTPSLNSVSYNASNEALYEFEAIDRAGNILRHSFTIDKTAPTIVSTSNPGLQNNNVTNAKSVILYITDLNGISSVSYTRNGGESIQAYHDPIFSQEGVYIITAIDRAGNEARFQFTIDRTPPTLTFISDLVLKDNIYMTNKNVSFTVSDNYLNVSNIRVIRNGQNIQAPDIYSTISYSLEGLYEITILDVAGNEARYTFRIDKTAPSLTLNGTVIMNSTIVHYYRDEIDLAALEEIWDYTTIKINGEEWLFDWVIWRHGLHDISITDFVGNYKEFKVFIDLVSPIFTSNSIDKSVPTNNQIINHNISLGFIDEFLSEVIIKKDNIIQTQIFTPSSFSYSSEGLWETTLSDRAGNTTTLIFRIDKTAPIILLNDHIITNPFYNTEVYINMIENEWEINKTLVYVDDLLWNINIPLTNEGFFTIRVKDIAGNEDTTYIIIDKTAPIHFAATNTNISLRPIPLWYEINNFAFNNYDDALTYYKEVLFASINPQQYNGELAVNLSGTIYNVYPQDSHLRFEGLYAEFYLFKTVTNTTYFFLDLNSLFNEIEKISISQIKTCFATSDRLSLPAYHGNESLGISVQNVHADSTYYSRTNLTLTASSLDLNSTINGLVDRLEFSYRLVGTSTWTISNIINIDGKYEIKLTDRAGNYSIYTIIIDKNAPIISVDNNEIESNRYINTVEINIQDSSSTYTTVRHFQNNILVNSWTTTNTQFLLSENGKYELISVDAARNTSAITTIFISKGTLNYNFNIADELEVYLLLPEESTLVSLEIYYSIDNNSFKHLDLANGYLSYRFNEEGFYRIHMQDNFGRVESFLIEYAKPLTEHLLNGDDNEPIINIPQIELKLNGVVIDNKNTNIFNESVKIEFSNNLKVLINGSPVLSGWIITENGTHNIVVKDEELNEEVKYTFIINSLSATQTMYEENSPNYILIFSVILIACASLTFIFIRVRTKKVTK